MARGNWRLVLQILPIPVILVAGGLFIWRLSSEEGLFMAQHPTPSRVKAPELEGGIGWLNTDRPLRLADLRGKIVLLDFWTYCCINCMHVIPDLKKLEAKYANQLVVIGVHSAKFTNEGDSANIRQAILRYEIEHPVVNDRHFRIWRAYGTQAWPTLILIDPEGYVVGGLSGEGHFSVLDQAISRLIAEFRARGKLDEEPVKLSRQKETGADTLLSYPGKIVADPSTNRLFVADSNHNRILICRADGTIVDVAGKGNIGAGDGSFAEASFHHPQGMALAGDSLYVADTENHLVRRLDLKHRKVATVAGTGEQALGNYRRGPGGKVALSSPWDLTVVKGKLYIAMAGAHQIWVMNLASGEIGPYAGSGREGRIDGPLNSAALAQPSGITSDGKLLYVADSEVSAIRSVSLDPHGRVSTIVGLDLFEFGDRDGQGSEVRLQHPLGVAYHHGHLYVADTYNHKVKVIDPSTGTCRTFLGRGKPGSADGQRAEFFEPGGVSVADNTLYLADTNNHAIRVADLSTGRVTTLALRGWENWQPDLAATTGEKIILPPQQLVPGKKGTITLEVKFPPSYKLNPGSPIHVTADMASGDTVKITSNQKMAGDHFPISLPVETAEKGGKAETHIRLTFVYCREGQEALCFMKSLHWQIPLEVVSTGGTDSIQIDYHLQPPELRSLTPGIS